MPRLHHSSDCSTVSTFCTDNDLGSRVYNGIYRFSCYLTSTELEGDIGLTMSACSAAHHAFEFSARLQTNWWLWAFTGLINFWSRSAQVLLFPGLWSVNHFPLIGTKKLRASLARIYWWSSPAEFALLVPIMWYPFAYTPLTGSALNLADEFVMSLHSSDWLFATIFNPLTRIIWLDPGQATFIMSSFTR